jgi:prepilin-type N-terminal cleavage/methylation domain-containing protein
MGKRVARGKMGMLPIGRSKKGSPPGFTFIEIIAVLAIFGLFVSVTTLRIENVLTGGDIRLATRIIMSEIRKVRGDAARSRKEHVLVLQIEENALYPVEPGPEQNVLWPANEDETARDYRHLPGGVSIEDVIVFPHGKVQEGEARICFFADGTIERSLIHLRNDKGVIYTLEINPLTGHVVIHDRYVDQKLL